MDLVRQIMETKKIQAFEFSKDDITEVNSYLTAAVGFSQVLGQLYTLTDVPLDKAKVFVAVYRIFNSCSNYIETPELREKIEFILADTSLLYLSIYRKYQIFFNEKGNFGKHKIYNDLIQEMMNKENMFKINLMIDLFIMFAERQVKYSLNKITGIDLETPEGKQVMKEVYSNGDEESPQ